MKRKKKANESDVVHEAGHAVAGVLLDRPFEAVSVELRKTTATVNGQLATRVYTVGIVELPGVLERRKADREAGVLDEATAVCNLAGMAAETLAGGTKEEVMRGGSYDAAYVRACVRNGGGSEEKAWETQATYFARAAELLGANWTAVNLVADSLWKHKRLAYEDVKARVEAAREDDAKSRGVTGAR